MRPGSRRIATVRHRSFAGSRLAAGSRRVAALTVALGVLCWAVLPAFSFSSSERFDDDTGASACRMSCADSKHCCCKPAATREESKKRVVHDFELSGRTPTESCPRDCATLTVVPGASTARSDKGVQRLAVPGADAMLHPAQAHAAIDQGLFDVARPRGPPAREANVEFLARVSTGTPAACASLHGEIPSEAHHPSGSSESRHPSAWHSDSQFMNGFEPRCLVCQQRWHRAAKGSLSGADVPQNGGTHE